VLQTYFFCNAYRELDKGSLYFKEQVRNRRVRAGGTLSIGYPLFRRPLVLSVLITWGNREVIFMAVRNLCSLGARSSC
jgi:hypothetical protein